MTAPPELPFQLVIHENGTEDGWAYVRVDDCLAAIAAADARGREQGLRDAAEMAFVRWQSWNLDCGVSCDVTACQDIGNAILALIPAPPPADGGEG